MSGELVAGFLLMLFTNVWLGAIYCEEVGISFCLAASLVISHSTLWLFLNYYGVSYLLLEFFNIKPNFQRKIINWLRPKGKAITLILNFVPLVPYLPTATIIAARITGIKPIFALPILFVSIIFRGFVLCYMVYAGVPLLINIFV